MNGRFVACGFYTREPIAETADAARVESSRVRYRAPLTFILVLTALVLYDSSHGFAQLIETHKFTERVNDLPPLLLGNYRADLDTRLKRYEERTGLAIIIVVISSLAGEEIDLFTERLFETNYLKRPAVARTILIVVSKREEKIGIETSQNLKNTFSDAATREKVIKAFKSSLAVNGQERGMEEGVQTVIEVINPWFNVFDPPSKSSGLVPSSERQAVNIILIFLAPFLGFMTGVVLMSFSSAGEFRVLPRILLSGGLGVLLAVAAAVVMRRPGGITPGIFYYSVIASFSASALVSAFRRLWFFDKFAGRKRGELIQIHYSE